MYLRNPLLNRCWSQAIQISEGLLYIALISLILIHAARLYIGGMTIELNFRKGETPYSRLIL